MHLYIHIFCTVLWFGEVPVHWILTLYRSSRRGLLDWLQDSIIWPIRIHCSLDWRYLRLMIFISLPLPNIRFIMLVILVIAAIILTQLGMLIRLAPLFQRLAMSQRSLNYIGPQIWNSLPDNIRNITCLSLFNIISKRYLIESYLPPK